MPPDHLARFIFKIISELNLRGIYARYGPARGPIASEILLGLLFFGYATEVSSSIMGFCRFSLRGSEGVSTLGVEDGMTDISFRIER